MMILFSKKYTEDVLLSEFVEDQEFLAIFSTYLVADICGETFL